jgi:alpha-N-acetylglucosaminidase
MSAMGGNLGLFGNFGELNTGPTSALALNASIAGVGIDPEGIDNNPAYYSFLLESAWRTTPIDTAEWLEQWGVQRCGGESVAARKAWALLARTVYANASAATYEHHMAYCPTTMPQGSGWDRGKGSERPKWYTHTDLYDAWGYLITAAEECPQSDAFTFDLVDVGREWLSISACNDAYDSLMNASSPAAVSAANASMSTVMSDLDRLLASSGGFLLGQWISDARAIAEEEMESQDADFLEWNARTQVCYLLLAASFVTHQILFRAGSESSC